MKQSFIQMTFAVVIGGFALAVHAHDRTPTTQPEMPDSNASAIRPTGDFFPATPSTGLTAPRDAYNAATTKRHLSETTMDVKTQADTDLSAIQTKCNEQTGESRDACLRDADENYERALGDSHSNGDEGQDSLRSDTDTSGSLSSDQTAPTESAANPRNPSGGTRRTY